MRTAARVAGAVGASAAHVAPIYFVALLLRAGLDVEWPPDTGYVGVFALLVSCELVLVLLGWATQLVGDR